VDVTLVPVYGFENLVDRVRVFRAGSCSEAGRSRCDRFHRLQAGRIDFATNLKQPSQREGLADGGAVLAAR
jgi:hypothetical protein